MVATSENVQHDQSASLDCPEISVDVEAKTRGDAACKLRKYEEAVRHYTDAARLTAGCPVVMSNRSLANFKLGNYEQAVEDAEEALCNFNDPVFATRHRGQELVEKAYLRKAGPTTLFFTSASSLTMLGHHKDAVQTYRKALQHLGPKARLVAKGMMGSMTEHPGAREEVSKIWASCIEDGQSPAALSSRDGKILKPVPKQHRLTMDKMTQALLDLPQDFHAKLMAGWTTGRGPGRAALAAARAWGYLQVKETKQALKDAQSAVAFGQTATSPCKWPPALAVLALCHEADGDPTQAVLAIGKVCELDNSHSWHMGIQERLVESLTQTQKEVFVSEGVAGLEKWLDDEYERGLPEFKRRRPKWYYYYEYMKKRINAIHEALPEPVMDKLLTMDAEELDLVLNYESAAKEQITELLGVLDEHGAGYLESYQPKMLSWEQVQRLQAEKAASQEHIAYAEIPPEAQRLAASPQPTDDNGTEAIIAPPAQTIITFGGQNSSDKNIHEEDIDLDALD